MEVNRKGQAAVTEGSEKQVNNPLVPLETFFGQLTGLEHGVLIISK